MLVFDFEVTKHDWLVVGIDPIKQTEYVIDNNEGFNTYTIVKRF